MGIYVNHTSTGAKLPQSGKLKALIEDGATLTHAEFQPNLICVVENDKVFDAALYCETEFDFLRTTRKEDTRKKTYIIHPNAADIADQQ